MKTITKRTTISNVITENKPSTNDKETPTMQRIIIAFGYMLKCYFSISYLNVTLPLKILNNLFLSRNVLYGEHMKFKIEVEAHKGKIKREYVVEASNGEELSRELARVEREWVIETGILNFTSTTFKIE